MSEIGLCRSARGKKITVLSIDETSLHFTFEDGSKIALRDNTQTCCEKRYMRTDDNLEAFIGSNLYNVEVRDGGGGGRVEDSDVHDIEFLLVSTSTGVFTISNHNEHNGYYGGFNIICQAE